MNGKNIKTIKSSKLSKFANVANVANVVNVVNVDDIAGNVEFANFDEFAKCIGLEQIKPKRKFDDLNEFDNSNDFDFAEFAEFVELAGLNDIADPVEFVNESELNLKSKKPRTTDSVIEPSFNHSFNYSSNHSFNHSFNPSINSPINQVSSPINQVSSDDFNGLGSNDFNGSGSNFEFGSELKTQTRTQTSIDFDEYNEKFKKYSLDCAKSMKDLIDLDFGDRFKYRMKISTIQMFKAIYSSNTFVKFIDEIIKYSETKTCFSNLNQIIHEECEQKIKTYASQIYKNVMKFCVGQFKQIWDFFDIVQSLYGYWNVQYIPKNLVAFIFIFTMKNNDCNYNSFVQRISQDTPNRFYMNNIIAFFFNISIANFKFEINSDDLGKFLPIEKKYVCNSYSHPEINPLISYDGIEITERLDLNEFFTNDSKFIYTIAKVCIENDLDVQFGILFNSFEQTFFLPIFAELFEIAYADKRIRNKSKQILFQIEHKLMNLISSSSSSSNPYPILYCFNSLFICKNDCNHMFDYTLEYISKSKLKPENFTDLIYSLMSISCHFNKLDYLVKTVEYSKNQHITISLKQLGKMLVECVNYDNVESIQWILTNVDRIDSLIHFKHDDGDGDDHNGDDIDDIDDSLRLGFKTISTLFDCICKSDSVYCFKLLFEYIIDYISDENIVLDIAYSNAQKCFSFLYFSEQTYISKYIICESCVLRNFSFGLKILNGDENFDGDFIHEDIIQLVDIAFSNKSYDGIELLLSRSYTLDESSNNVDDHETWVDNVFDSLINCDYSNENLTLEQKIYYSKLLLDNNIRIFDMYIFNNQILSMDLEHIKIFFNHNVICNINVFKKCLQMIESTSNPNPEPDHTDNSTFGFNKFFFSQLDNHSFVAKSVEKFNYMKNYFIEKNEISYVCIIDQIIFCLNEKIEKINRANKIEQVAKSIIKYQRKNINPLEKSIGHFIDAMDKITRGIQ